jgi:hypothetical protein
MGILQTIQGKCKGLAMISGTKSQDLIAYKAFFQEENLGKCK